MRRLLQKTIETWQPLSDRELKEEDARQMVENVTAFFELLEEWDREDREVEYEQDAG